MYGIIVEDQSTKPSSADFHRQNYNYNQTVVFLCNKMYARALKLKED